MKCKHPADDVAADILEGDYSKAQVRWCHRCGAYQIFAKNYQTPWRVPSFSIWERIKAWLYLKLIHG